MAIEWTQEPAYGFGGYAKPVSLAELCIDMYEDWDGSTMGPFYQPGPSGNGWYVYAVGGNNINKIASLVEETAPTAFIGLEDGDTLPKTRTLMTILFPNAHRRWGMTMTITASGTNYAITLQGKWFDENNVEKNDVVDLSGQWTGMATWFVSTLGLPKPPGEFVVNHIHVDGGVQKEVVGFTYGGSYDIGDGRPYYQINARMVNIIEWAAYLQAQNPTMDFGVWETEDISPEVGPASGQAGYTPGTHDPWSSDIVGLPPKPSLSAIDIGFVNMYKAEVGELTNLGEEIFPDFNWTAPTGIDLLDAVLNIAMCIPNVVAMYSNAKLIDYVQDCHIIPVSPTVSVNKEHIKLGFREMSASCYKVTDEYVDFSCGTINVTECWTSFADYQPYTRAKLFLPFVGYVPVEPEYWQSGSLAVDYRFNARDGSFMAFVRAFPDRSKGSRLQGQVIGSYSGNACIHVPLTGLNYSSMVSGIVGGAAALMAGVSGTGGLMATASAALNTASASPQVQSSNSYSGASAFLGIRRPFLLIERTLPHYAKNYQHDKGLPSYITTQLKNASGYVEVKDVDLNLSGFRASKEEKDAIRKLLASGIYV